jgi:two-component system sensor histidine kinase/response regulator
MTTNKFKKARILIIDDLISNIELLETILYSSGYLNITSSNKPQEIVELYQTFKPDLILLDLMMPEMNGFEVMEVLKKMVPVKSYLPILVITADASKETKEKALGAGAKDFITRPFDINEIKLRINNLLETRFLHSKIEKKNNELTVKVKERTNELQKAYNEIMIVNQQLELLNTAKIEFLSIISHEVRTPLNGIKGFTEILKKRIDSPQLLEYLQYLEASVQRLEEFSLHALLITQLRTKFYKLELVEIPFVSILGQVENELQAKLNEKRLKIEYQKDANLSIIKADSNLLKICFECLIKNAITYSPNNSTITVNAYFEKNKTIIEFIDEGKGFSKEALQKIYLLFAVGQKHIDKNPGLSLALIKLIMDAHNGRIQVLNNLPNGAIVQLQF